MELSLSEARGLLGWSQSRLAEESDVKAANISDIETGKNANPTYQMVMRIVNALQRGGLKGLKAEDVFAVPEPDEMRA